MGLTINSGYGATNALKVGSGSSAGYISSNGSQDLILNTNSGSDSGSITITDGADGNIAAVPRNW